LGATPSPRLLGLGLAIPDLCWPQPAIAAALADLWNLKGAALARWRRIVAGSGIDTRHSVLPMDQIIGLSTQDRMEAFEAHAGGLAARAASRALRCAAVAASDVTELIVVSCTGFSAPGVDVALVESLGLRPTVRRTIVGFMGCFGAVSGLRTAVGACSAQPRAVALVVCLELCSLHLRPDRSAQNQVSAALFSDGAAAVVVGGARAGLGSAGPAACNLGRLTMGGSLLIPEGRGWMSWRITDAGFAMTLSRDVPTAVRRNLCAFVAEAAPVAPNSFIVHPGGPDILDAVDDALRLEGGRGLDAARAVLRRYGNMSSATVLFVLEEALRRGHALPAVLLAFGPGLTIESLMVLPSCDHVLDNGPFGAPSRQLHT
jgi:predicted naringenin-chalcone synthase